MSMQEDSIPQSVVGITGDRGAGRRTFARMLADRFDATVVRFDAPLGAASVRLSDPSAIGPAWPEPAVREIIAETVRDIDPGLLPAVAAARMAGLKMVILPDVRTQREALTCSYIMHIEREGTLGDGAHLRKYADMVIHNGGDLIDLGIKADQVVADAGGGPYEGDGGRKIVY